MSREIGVGSEKQVGYFHVKIETENRISVIDIRNGDAYPVVHDDYNETILEYKNLDTIGAIKTRLGIW